MAERRSGGAAALRRRWSAHRAPGWLGRSGRGGEPRRRKKRGGSESGDEPRGGGAAAQWRREGDDAEAAQHLRRGAAAAPAPGAAPSAASGMGAASRRPARARSRGAGRRRQGAGTRAASASRACARSARRSARPARREPARGAPGDGRPAERRHSAPAEEAAAVQRLCPTPGDTRPPRSRGAHEETLPRRVAPVDITLEREDRSYAFVKAGETMITTSCFVDAFPSAAARRPRAGGWATRRIATRCGARQPKASQPPMLTLPRVQDPAFRRPCWKLEPRTPVQPRATPAVRTSSGAGAGAGFGARTSVGASVGPEPVSEPEPEPGPSPSPSPSQRWHQHRRQRRHQRPRPNRRNIQLRSPSRNAAALPGGRASRRGGAAGRLRRVQCTMEQGVSLPPQRFDEAISLSSAAGTSI